MKKRIFYFILLIFTLLNSCVTTNIKKENKTENSHIIILKDGKEYKGKLKEIQKEKVVFEINGEEKEINKKNIVRIQFQQKRQYEDINNISEIPDPEIKQLFESSKKWKPNQNEQIVILFDKTEYIIEEENVTVKLKKALKILNEEGKEYSTQYFYYLGEKLNANLLYGITINPDGKITAVEESAVNDEPINNNIPHYNLLNRKKFGLKDVEIGSVIIWEAEIKRKWDILSNPLLIEKQLITNKNIENKILKIKFPKSLNFNYKIYKGLIPFNENKIKTESDKNMTVYTYEQNNIKGYIEDEKSTPSDSLIYPKLYIYPEYDWTELSDKYYEKYFDIEIDDKIKQQALIITKNEKNDLNKLKKLYDFVAREINLADIPMSEFLYTPALNSSLIQKSDLNVLDKSYYFTLLARSINIPVKMYLYRSNYKNNIINETASIKLFNSSVCIYKSNNEKLYYSFESQNLKPDKTFYSLSESSALDVSSKNSKLENLRKIPYTKNIYHYEYKGELKEDNSLILKKTTIIIGTGDIGWRKTRFLSKEEMDKYIKSSLAGFGNDVELLNYKVINPLDDFDKPVKIELNVKINNFAFSSGKNIKLLKIPELQYSSGSVSKKTRKLPYDLGSTYESTYNFEIKIPEKYKVINILEELKLDNDDFSFLSEIKYKNNKINIMMKSIYKKDIIPVSKYIQLKDYKEQKAKLTNEWILLEVK